LDATSRPAVGQCYKAPILRLEITLSLRLTLGTRIQQKGTESDSIELLGSLVESEVFLKLYA